MKEVEHRQQTTREVFMDESVILAEEERLSLWEQGLATEESELTREEFRDLTSNEKQRFHHNFDNWYKFRMGAIKNERADIQKERADLQRYREIKARREAAPIVEIVTSTPQPKELLVPQSQELFVDTEVVIEDATPSKVKAQAISPLFPGGNRVEKKIPIIEWKDRCQNRFKNYTVRPGDFNPFQAFHESDIPQFEGIPAQKFLVNSEEVPSWPGLLNTMEFRHWSLSAKIENYLPAHRWLKILGFRVPPRVWEAVRDYKIRTLSMLFILKRATTIFDSTDRDTLIDQLAMCNEYDMATAMHTLAQRRNEFFTADVSKTFRKMVFQEVCAAWWMTNKAARDEICINADYGNNLTPVITPQPLCTYQDVNEYGATLEQMIAQCLAENRFHIAKTEVNANLIDLTEKFVLFLKKEEVKQLSQGKAAQKFNSWIIGIKGPPSFRKFFQNC